MNEMERTAATFDAEHEGQDGCVVWEGWIIYADGARRSVASYAPLGSQMAEPHPNEVQRRKWVRIFWETRLEDLAEQFEAVKLACRNNAQSNGPAFNRRLGQLKELQTQVRSARSKLAHIATQERGYTQADVSRAWEVWTEFVEASREESEAKHRYESALLGKSSAGQLEKLKHRYDEARERSARAIQRWNGFTPVEARSVVGEQLDTTHQAERFAELAEIEI